MLFALKCVICIFTKFTIFAVNKTRKYMKIKNYKDLTPQEQLEFVTKLADFEKVVPVLEAHKNRLSDDDRTKMSDGLKLIGAFPNFRTFVDAAFRYGDFEGRVYRLRHCVERIKKEIGKEISMQTVDGQPLAYIPAMQQQFRRRGRPTKEESAALARGAANATSNDIEMRKLQAIASLLGAEIVTNQTLREKNNDELRQEREERQEAYNKQNPSLFSSVKESEESVASGSVAGTPASIPPTVESLSQTRLHLDQVRFLLSPTLQERIDTVRELRQKASNAAEAAKRMALEGKQPDEIKPFAQEAADATEQYEAIYADVDNELATVFYRLKNDGDYADRFAKRFNIKDFTAILKQLHPYYDKVKTPEFELRMKALIEQESPEYVARMKAENAKKEEIEGILRYLRRKDKPATQKRLDTAKNEKYPRLVELMGKEKAKAFYPLVTAIEEEYNKSKKS